MIDLLGILIYSFVKEVVHSVSRITGPDGFVMDILSPM